MSDVFDIVCCHDNSSMWLESEQMSSGRVYFMTQKAATKTQISCLHVSQHERSWSGEQRRGERRVCAAWRRVAGGGKRCRDHHQDSHGAVEGGNINWYSSKSGIAFFPYTRCIPSPQQHRGRPGKFKYLKESKLTCWADKHFVTKEKVEF